MCLKTDYLSIGFVVAVCLFLSYFKQIDKQKRHMFLGAWEENQVSAS